MERLRTHGPPPYRLVVVHGGPGARGEMGPVARGLANRAGVLEPFQNEASLAGQIRALSEALRSHAACPVILIGFSWGAWLAGLVAGQHPGLVRKLILIGSAPFQTHYVPALTERRMNRLTAQEQGEYQELLISLGSAEGEESTRLTARLGELALKTDTYDLDQDAWHEAQTDMVKPGYLSAVWAEGAQLRESGELLKQMKQIQCPVVALHGEYDPHPSAGVQEPLSKILKAFRFYLLEKCGHKPWVERWARERFFAILNAEVGF